MHNILFISGHLLHLNLFNTIYLVLVFSMCFSLVYERISTNIVVVVCVNSTGWDQLRGELYSFCMCLGVSMGICLSDIKLKGCSCSVH